MPTLGDAKRAMAHGLAFPCAMCRHYWSAAPEVKDDLWKCGQSDCGGPLVGKTYPKFEGALPDGDWARFCFVCACPDTVVGVKVPGGGRVLALCEQHKGLLEQYEPTEPMLAPLPPILLPGK